MDPQNPSALFLGPVPEPSLERLDPTLSHFAHEETEAGGGELEAWPKRTGTEQDSTPGPSAPSASPLSLPLACLSVWDQGPSSKSR